MQSNSVLTNTPIENKADRHMSWACNSLIHHAGQSLGPLVVLTQMKSPTTFLRKYLTVALLFCGRMLWLTKSIAPLPPACIMAVVRKGCLDSLVFAPQVTESGATQRKTPAYHIQRPPLISAPHLRAAADGPKDGRSDGRMDTPTEPKLYSMSHRAMSGSSHSWSECDD